MTIVSPPTVERTNAPASFVELRPVIAAVPLSEAAAAMRSPGGALGRIITRI